MSKIMLVEDDDSLREIYEARLAAEGYEIVTARNGEDALVVAKENRPDLIISDVMMPNISGFDMLDILRNTQGLHDAKVIMLTALGQADDKLRAEKLGADRYLVKSQVTLEDIVNATAELLGGDTTAPAAPVAEAAEAVAAPSAEATVESPELAPVAAPDAVPTPEPVAVEPTETPAQDVPDTSPQPAQVQPEPQNQPPVGDPAATEQPASQPQDQPQAAAADPIDPPVNNQPAPEPEPAEAEVAPTPNPALTVQPSASADQTQATPPVSLEPETDPATTSVTDMPLAEAPTDTPENNETQTISMPPSDESAPDTNEAANQQPIEETAPLAPDPDPAPAPAPTLNGAPAAIDQAAAIHVAKAQTSDNEGSAVQQQIDKFEAAAPINTPEFDPESSSFNPTESPDVASTDDDQTVTGQEVQAPQAPEPVNPAAEPTQSSPSQQDDGVVRPTEPMPTPPQAAPEPEAPRPAPLKSSTGGNRVIAPLEPAESNAGPSLDDLLAKEQANTPPAEAAPEDPNTQPQQNSSQQQPPSPSQSVFDPDDPSSVSL